MWLYAKTKTPYKKKSFVARVRHITEWRDKLDQCLKDLNLEISVQKDAKEACERALEAKVIGHWKLMYADPVA